PTPVPAPARFWLKISSVCQALTSHKQMITSIFKRLHLLLMFPSTSQFRLPSVLTYWQTTYCASVPVIQSESLLLSRAQASRHDSALYSLTASNSLGTSPWVKLTDILVKEEIQKPVIDLKLAGTLTVKVGESVRIEAALRGKPQPEVKWMKDKAVGDNPRISYETGPNYSKFLMTKSRRTDSGKYVITATNSAGTFTAYANINVLDVPGPVRNLRITGIGADKCRVVWDAPEDDGVDTLLCSKRPDHRGGWSEGRKEVQVQSGSQEFSGSQPGPRSRGNV
uniref:Ig-like domain-containing protein n=1 Tax=Mola mola TaxID=94237 RepID=A0A3Q3X2U1_MOLML